MPVHPSLPCPRLDEELVPSFITSCEQWSRQTLCQQTIASEWGMAEPKHVCFAYIIQTTAVDPYWTQCLPT